MFFHHHFRSRKRTHYWFKPKRFWGIFAAYYPVTWEAWIITLATAAVLIGAFITVDADSHSASDTLIRLAPVMIVVLVIFDLISFRTGEYPSWWRRSTKR